MVVKNVSCFTGEGLHLVVSFLIMTSLFIIGSNQSFKTLYVKLKSRALFCNVRYFDACWNATEMTPAYLDNKHWAQLIYMEYLWRFLPCDATAQMGPRLPRSWGSLNHNNNNIYLLQLGCHPVAVVILHVNKTWNWLLLNLSREGYMRSM